MSDERAQEESRSAVDHEQGAQAAWRDKIEKAQLARELAQQMRKGRPTSFRRAVGRAAG